MKKVLFTAMMFGEAALSPLLASMPLIDEIAARDKAADDAVAAIRTTEELAAKQRAWRTCWLDALGGMPARTPLNARVVGTVQCEGFRLENVIFESQPGVYVTAHLAMPAVRTRGSASRPPVVLMPLGHSDAGILNPRYAAHLAMAARAGIAAFAWDPISQGERRQATDRKYDYTDNCSTEHTRLGARGWLVGWNFARFRIWDAVRAIDDVKSRTDLDGSKIGIMGTSGGGTMSAYLQAFDPRIKVAFPNCYVSSLREVIGARGWLVGWNYARFRIWDAVRAIDYVESRADLDCSKLGIMGTSGGGTMSAYMQAFDPRIKVAFPNCYVSSIREVFRGRGCHDAEQFFWNMLPNGFNHVALLAMGPPRVSLAIGSRWKDYFPHAGAVATFAVLTNMTECLGFAGPYWHFSCDGPHGLPPSTRAAQTDWMRHCIFGASAPKPLDDYHILDRAGTDAKDPCHATLPFPAEATFCTPTHQVRDLPGFKSVYALIADEARRLAK